LDGCEGVPPRVAGGFSLGMGESVRLRICGGCSPGVGEGVSLSVGIME